MRLTAAALVLLTATLHAESMKTEKATLGGGCFWCVEAVYNRLPGVTSIVSGYAGGETDNPTYEQVTTGRTGHAEVVQIEFNPDEVTYEQLIDRFWSAHDPTTLNRQGADVGTQYRSIILTTDEDQDRIARASMERAQARFRNPIVTQIVPLEKFHPAEDYHQNFYERNPHHPYNQAVIRPKLEKLEQKEAGQ